MKIKPILTEKSMAKAQNGQYSFWVSVRFTKFQIKELINKAFGVHVVSVKTQNHKGGIKLTLTRKKVKVLSRKKAIVTLKEKERIDLFEVEKKGKKKK